MPFNKRAIIEIENQNDLPYGQYFYIDFERYPEPLQDDIAYFHAMWRRDNPCSGWAPNLQTNSPEVNIPNLDGTGNYVILETEGRGQYVGCNLSVAHFQGSWWGEGDEMIFVDDDTWPPSIHGTGTEDYFNHAWGMQNNAFLMNGSVVHESVVPGYQVSYRFHLTDPVRFAHRIRVTIEHGHANHLSDDWASTAYWYQTLPSPNLDGAVGEGTAAVGARRSCAGAFTTRSARHRTSYRRLRPPIGATRNISGSETSRSRRSWRRLAGGRWPTFLEGGEGKAS